MRLVEAMMPSPNQRSSVPASTSSALSGIIACLGALVDEAQAIGDTRAADVLLDAMQKLRNHRIFH
jgi:hypothetical protein